MPVLINWKICDNAKECDGVANCPTGALSWDEKKQRIIIINGKCISCGLCVKACLVNAISLAKNEKEYKRIKKEFADDPRKVSDLFVDRYGAAPIHPAFLFKESSFNTAVLQSNKTVVVEVFIGDSVKCLLRSIPIKILLEGKKDIKYRKFESKEGVFNRYKIKKYPALLIFKKGRLKGRIEGYYEMDEKDLLINKVNKIIG